MRNILLIKFITKQDLLIIKPGKINYVKTLVLPPECEKENNSKLVPSNVSIVYSTNNTIEKTCAIKKRTV